MRMTCEPSCAADHATVGPDFSRRLAVLAALLALAYPALMTWVYFILMAGQTPDLQRVVYAVGKSLQFGFPAVWFLVVERLLAGKSVTGWHLFAPTKTESPAAGVVQGGVFGGIVLAAMLVAYHVWLKPAGVLAAAGHLVEEKLTGFGIGASPAAFLAVGVFYSLGHSLLEEYYWRWFTFGQLRRLVSLWPAIAVSSLGFMAHHVLVLGFYFGWTSPATLLFSLAVAVGGAVWAWLYERSGSLWGPWLSHLLIDAGIFLIGYDLVASG
jgi:uncharacterized protein